MTKAIKTTTDLIEQLTLARKRSVPIIVVRTSDQFSTARAIYTSLDSSKGAAMLTWDAVRGIVAFNPKDVDAKKAVGALGVDAEQTINFTEAMVAATKTPERALLFAFNAHRQLMGEPAQTASSVQAVLNLRDIFKQNFRTLVIAAPYFVAPPELEHDVVFLDDPLPGPEVLKQIVCDLHSDSDIKVPDVETMDRAIDALSGLSSFAAEQVTAMSLSQSGLDLDGLWERKRLTVEQTRGLRVYRGTETFADIKGLDNVKARLAARKQARTPVGVCVFIDEIDKVMANVEHDTTGVRMDQLRTLLTEMEDNDWNGIVLVGPPGGGKTLLAKAFGNEARVPTIALDLGDMEGPHVGESEAMLRTAMKVIKSVGRGNAFFIATSNNASVMRPELQRRFTKGTFFVDLMNAEERDATWAFYLKRYGIDTAQTRPADDGWTAAEIRNCVVEAWDTGMTLVEAAQFVMPVSRARGPEIEAMRMAAHGKYISASVPGPYSYSAEAMANILRAIDMSKDKVN